MDGDGLYGPDLIKTVRRLPEQVLGFCWVFGLILAVKNAQPFQGCRLLGFFTQGRTENCPTLG